MVSAPRAADLPVGSVVRSASSDLLATKRRDTVGHNAWDVQGLGPFYNHEIDRWLNMGGTLVRVGDGSGQ